ncbi:MAG: ACT domain-containing protein [Plesiomonas sp.]|uniref:ACT domain-containing protein n=1 Tax=Plesiomonas sp. TaxID=2486279 RepID=UPI003F3EC1E0
MNKEKENHGETHLAILLKNMQPALNTGDYVFVTVVKSALPDILAYQPQGLFTEQEGITAILLQQHADTLALSYSSVFNMITLTIHSSLDAVGLTAAVAGKLADYNISANVVAAYYHDHIFVPKSQAQQAMQALNEFSQS